MLEKNFFPLVKEISPRWKSKYPKYDNGWAFWKVIYSGWKSKYPKKTNEVTCNGNIYIMKKLSNPTYSEKVSNPEWYIYMEENN